MLSPRANSKVVPELLVSDEVDEQEIKVEDDIIDPQMMMTLTPVKVKSEQVIARFSNENKSQ